MTDLWRNERIVSKYELNSPEMSLRTKFRFICTLVCPNPLNGFRVILLGTFCDEMTDLWQNDGLWWNERNMINCDNSFVTLGWNKTTSVKEFFWLLLRIRMWRNDWFVIKWRICDEMNGIPLIVPTVSLLWDKIRQLL